MTDLARGKAELLLQTEDRTCVGVRFDGAAA